MRPVPVVLVGLCVCSFVCILGCKPAKRPSGKRDPWDSLRPEGRRGRVVKERSPQVDWEKMRAHPEDLAFVWADYEEPSLYSLLVVTGTGEAAYTYRGEEGYLQRRRTVPQESLDTLWETIGTSGFLHLEREYYAKDIVDGLALTIAVRGKGGQKLVYAYNYFPKSVREVTTAVIEEVLGTAPPPPVDLNRVLLPDYATWGWVPASSAERDNVWRLRGVLYWAKTRGLTPRDCPSPSPEAVNVGSTWLNLLWVEADQGQPRWVLDVAGYFPGGGEVDLAYMDGEQPSIPAKPGAADGGWKQVGFVVDEETCLELKRLLLSSEVVRRGGVGQETGTEADRVSVTLRTATLDGELYFRDFSCNASDPEVARIAKFLREKVIAPHGEEMAQARTLSSAEAWTYLQLLKFATPEPDTTRPDMRGLTLLLWCGGVALMVVGFVLTVFVKRRRMSRQTEGRQGDV